MRLPALLALSLLLAGCASGRFTADQDSALWALMKGDYIISTNLVATGYAASDFRVGSEEEDWDSGHRIELEVLYHFDVVETFVEPFGGAYLYYEEHDWDDGAASVDVDFLGAGIEMGAAVHFFEPHEQHRFNLAVVPYGRFGLAYQDGSVRNVRSSRGISSGEIDGSRGEASVGLDLRAMIANRFHVSIGGGLSYWSGSDAEVITRDPGGQIIDEDDELRFKGDDVYFRFSVGLRF